MQATTVIDIICDYRRYWVLTGGEDGSASEGEVPQPQQDNVSGGKVLLIYKFLAFLCLFYITATFGLVWLVAS